MPVLMIRQKIDCSEEAGIFSQYANRPVKLLFQSPILSNPVQPVSLG